MVVNHAMYVRAIAKHRSRGRSGGAASSGSSMPMELTRWAGSAGAQLGDRGWAIQRQVEGEGFSGIRGRVGHGGGGAPHEEPQVPNYGVRNRGFRMQAGLVIAIEPMVNAGGPEIRTLDDEWTVVTGDGCLSAHFEHTVAVTAEGPRVLTRVATPARAAGEA